MSAVTMEVGDVLASSMANTLISSPSSRSSTKTLVELPNELLRHIFLYSDPATLCTTVRALNRAWKHSVETELLTSHFANKDWRVGLRVIRKLPATHPDIQAEPQQQDDDLYRLNVLNRRGAMEPYAVTTQPRTITHVIPLSFKHYDSENVSLRFDTDQTWHSLFQVSTSEDEVQEQEEGAQQPDHAEESDSDEDDGQQPIRLSAAQARARARADTARLELDFGLVWRFPDDGQDADVYDIKSGDTESWGQPDPENGWLSRFYCSNFDTLTSEPPTGSSSPAVLQSTPLTRRARSSRLHSAVERRMHDIVDDDDDNSFHPAQMVWSDQGHEYMSLDLSLGLEFFVRRSARANQLVRRLEAAAADADARDVVQQLTQKLTKGKSKARKGARSSLNPSSANSRTASGWTTPLEVASPPPSRITTSMDPRRRAMQNALDKEAQKEASSPLRGKAYTKDDDGATSGTQTPEQPSSAPSFLSPSMMPSRFSSAAPSRQGGGSVGSRSSYGTKSRPGKSGSAPRATFQAKLLRAERLPTRPSSPASPTNVVDAESSNSSNAANTPVDRVGWTGGDKYGRGSFRLAHEWTEDLESDKYLDALSNSGVTTPVTWTWSR